MKKISVFIQAIVITLFGNIYYANAQLVVSTTVLQNVTCHGGSNGIAGASASSGTSPYTYSWSPGSETNRTATGLSAATYTVHVQDVHGLTGTATATISQPTALSVTASAKYASVCAGQSDSLFATASGGTLPFSYSWTAPYGDITCPTCANTLSYPYGAAYMVTAVYDGNGCSASSSVNVTVDPIPLTTISGPINPIAPGRSDTLIANAIGATSYTWSNSATTSSIIVSPSVSTTYSITVHNTYGCTDTAHYTIDTNSIGSGSSSTSPIRIVPSTTVNMASFSTKDSVVWFSFIPTDSNNQIIGYSNFLGLPVPHIHRLTLYDNSLKMLVDEPMPDITGANQIRIDISHLHVGNTYYVRAARTPAHTNMAGCNPSATGECNPSQRWDFQMAFRTVPVFVPKDSGGESPSVSQLYYEDRGQISDVNDIPRFDIKAYTNFASPSVYASDSAVSFVYGSTDSMQRVDMVLAGSGVQPSQPVFKMEEDSNAGYLNYFKEFIENGVPQIEGYSRLVYKNVYANVDMHVYSNNMGTKLYFVCNPGGTGGGGNPANIELQFKGANSVSLTADSGINVVTNMGTLTFAPGYAYMDSAGVIKPKAWHANFEVVNSNTVRFHTGTFNTSEPLIIQVDRGHVNQSSGSCNGNLCWSTYYGGKDLGNLGTFNAVAHNYLGNICATGYTSSKHFPVRNGIQNGYGGDTDAVVVRFDTNTFARIWATYYGGSGQDIGRSIIASSTSVFITGSTNSADLDTISHRSAYHQAGGLNGTGSGSNTDAFIAEIDIAGFPLQWSTYYGGSGNESGHGIAFNAAPHTGTTDIYVAGVGDTNTPLLHEAGAYNSSTGTGLILKFNVDGVREWATLIGSNTTGFNGCAGDGNDNIYVTGASGPGYPNMDFGYGGHTDAVITKFDGNDTIVWSTYYGGRYTDIGNAIAIDANGNVYVAGHSYSFTLPQGLGPYSWSYVQDTNGNGASDSVDGNAFIVEFAPLAYPLVTWGTFLGGRGDMDAYGIALDANNDVYITGYFNSSTNVFVWPPDGQPVGAYVQNSAPIGPTETFVAAFNNDAGYYWGTYLCEPSVNSLSTGYGITAFSDQNLFVVGSSAGPGTSDFPFVNPGNGAWFQDTLGHAYDIGYISEFNLVGIPTETSQLKAKSGELKVYPNPTAQNITVQMNMQQSGEVEYIVYNLLGEPVYTVRVNQLAGTVNQQIPLSTLPNGNYILQVISGSSIYHAKITKLQ